MSRRRRGKMDWKQQRGEEADQWVPVSQGWLTGIEGRRFHCCLLFSCVSLFTFPWEAPPIDTHKYDQHTCMQTMEASPKTGGEVWTEKGMHLLGAGFFNLWLIIIWPDKGRGWGNSSVGLDCNLLCFSFPLQSNVRAEQRPNRGTGCLHVWRRPSLLVLLHNMRFFNGEGLHSADSNRAMRV